MLKTNFWVNFFLFAALCLNGCGYATKAYFLPADIKTVYIQTLQNKTDQPNLENELKIKLVEAFQDDGNLEVTSSSDADAILKGTITGYTRQAMRYDNDENIQEYRLTVTVNFEFLKYKSGKSIVQADNFSGDASFYISGANVKSESTARAEALENLSRRMLNKIITLW